MINVTPTTSNKAASGRGTRSASSLRAAGDKHDADDESRRDGQQNFPSQRTERSQLQLSPESPATKLKSAGGGLGEADQGSLALARLLADVGLRATAPPFASPARGRSGKERAGRASSATLRRAPEGCRRLTRNLSDHPRRAARRRKPGRGPAAGRAASLSPNSSLSLVRALLRRLLMVPISTPQMAAASS